MKKIMEKVSILLLSFMLISAFSISSSLPAMKEFFSAYSASQVDLLVSVPSFGVLTMLVLTGFLEKYLSERAMIITGLLLLSISGLVPVFVQDYWLIFLSRFGLGLGTGAINAKAISIISERYQGRERVQTLGLRGSAEVVGSAILTLAVGQLLAFGWQASFLIYGFGLLILVFFLLFVPYKKGAQRVVKEEKTEQSLNAWQSKYSLVLAFIACVIITINTVISLRVPGMVIDQGLGTAATASLVLSAMQLVGILAGLSFAPLFHVFGKNLLTWACLGFALGLLLLAFPLNIWFLLSASLVAGFTYSIALTTIFNAMSDRIPGNLLNKATSYVLLGCNLGGAISSFVVNALGMISSSFTVLFVLFAVAMLAVAGLAFALKSRIKGE